MSIEPDLDTLKFQMYPTGSPSSQGTQGSPYSPNTSSTDTPTTKASKSDSKTSKTVQKKHVKHRVLLKPGFNTKLGACYAIPRQAITDHQLKVITEKLTVKPIQTSLNTRGKSKDKDQTNSSPFAVYALTQDTLYVPRFFGISEFGPPKQITVSEGEPMASGMKCLITLQEERSQIDAYEAVMIGLQKAPMHGGVLSLPCGFGKTETALYVAHKLGRKTLILVNGNTVREEWLDRIQKRLPQARVGILQQNIIQIADRDFVVATVHSVVRRNYKDLQTFGFVIVDEAHHMAARTFSQAMSKIPAKWILGLSATFRRSDGLDSVLEWILGKVIFKADRPKGPMLVHQIVYRGGEAYKDKDIPFSRWGHAKILKTLDNDRQRNFLILSILLYCLRDPKRQIAIFSKTLEILDQYSTMIKALGIPSVGFYTGKTPAKERQEARTKRVILSTVQMGQESLNIPTLNTLIMLHPIGDSEQIAGRILREAGKSRRIETKTSDDTCTDPEPDTETKTTVTGPRPLFFDIVDKYAHLEGMSWRRYRQFSALGYHVVRTDDNAVGPHLSRRLASLQLRGCMSPDISLTVLNYAFGDCRLQSLHK